MHCAATSVGFTPITSISVTHFQLIIFWKDSQNDVIIKIIRHTDNHSKLCVWVVAHVTVM